MFSEEQLNVIDRPGQIVHLDATGSVVRKPKDINCKRILYYAIVIKADTSVLPLAEMITSEHDISSISIFLKRYRHFVQIKTSKSPYFSVVIVDWSWALINSLMIEWNRLNITEYLNLTYISVTECIPLCSDITIIHTCCAHFMKRISTNIHKKFPKMLPKKNIIMEGVALMLLSRTLSALDSIYETFMTIFISNDQQEAERNIVKLKRLQSIDFEDIISVYDSDDEDEIDNDITLDTYRDEGGIFINSPFFTHFNRKLEDIKRTHTESTGINDYHSIDVANHITYRYMPFVPMWSGLLLYNATPNISRLSNAYVESFFNVIKSEVLTSEKNLKIGRFINKLKRYKSSLVAEANIGIPLKRRRTLKRYYPESPTNILIKEQWKRKQKAKYSHMEARYLGTLKNKIEAKTSLRTAKSEISTNEISPRSTATSSVQGSDSSVHINAMNNGLFLDIDYYFNNEQQLTIGHYSALRDTPIVSDKDFHLFSPEFCTLQNEEWIDDAVIDSYVIAQLQNWPNIAYVITGYTTYILGDKCLEPPAKNWPLYSSISSCTGKILLPYLYQQHWRLFVVDVPEKTLTLLDPYDPTTDEKRAVRMFKTFINRCTNANHLRRINWTIKKCTDKRPLQSYEDANNCGVYVIYYIHCIGNNLNFEESILPRLYRRTIAE